ncbi:MAG: hypothetical protein M5U34_02250 [Chloroflexi bacterium]|nr:hypothetical protein [Chloroflexota bacterium]
MTIIWRRYLAKRWRRNGPGCPGCCWRFWVSWGALPLWYYLAQVRPYVSGVFGSPVGVGWGLILYVAGCGGDNGRFPLAVEKSLFVPSDAQQLIPREIVVENGR